MRGREITHQKRRGERGKPTKSMKWRGKKRLQEQGRECNTTKEYKGEEKRGRMQGHKEVQERGEEGENREDTIPQMSIRERREDENAITKKNKGEDKGRGGICKCRGEWKGPEYT